MRLLGALERDDVEIRLEVLDHPLLHEQQRQHETHRQEDVERAAREVDPEIAEPAGRLARDAAHERHGDRDAHRRRHEVVKRQLRHLREVRHHLLAGVRLPVRVRRERRRRLERLPVGYGGEVLRIERQQMLEAQHEIREQHARQAEQQHAAGVARPVLILGRIDAAQAIDRPLDRAEPRERPVVHANEIQSQRLGDEQHAKTEKENL